MGDREPHEKLLKIMNITVIIAAVVLVALIVWWMFFRGTAELKV